MYDRLPVNAAPAAVVAALRDVLRERGITEYAVVDHGHDMAAAGQPAYPAWTLIFGNPATGARLLASDLAAAVDIPLRLAVIGRGAGSEIVLRDMRTLIDADLADDFTESYAGSPRQPASASSSAAPDRTAPRDADRPASDPPAGVAWAGAGKRAARRHLLNGALTEEGGRCRGRKRDMAVAVRGRLSR